MLVKTCHRILHVLYNILELEENVVIVLLIVKTCLIFHVEWLAHIKSVKPYLIRVDVLVPEASLCCTRHELNLAVDEIYRFAVLFLAREVVQLEESLSCIHIVNVKLGYIIAINRPVIVNAVVDESIGKIKIFLFLCDGVHLKKGFNHTPIDIVPCGFESLQNLFYIPDRSVGCALCKKLFYVPVDYTIIHSFPPCLVIYAIL